MAKHPDTGEDISGPVYNAIMNERALAAEAVLRTQAASSQRLNDYERVQPSPERPTGISPLLSFMFFVMFVAMICMGGFTLWIVMRGGAVAPVAPVVVPSNNVDAMVAPIRQKLAYDPDKAKATWKAYSGFREAIKKSGERIRNTQDLAYVQSAILKDVDIKPGKTPIGRDIDQAIATQLGITWGRDKPGEAEGWAFKAFDDADRVKLAEVIDAIARAAEAGL